MFIGNHTFDSNGYTIKNSFGFAFLVPLRRRLGSRKDLISFDAKERYFVLGRTGKIQQRFSHGRRGQFARLKRRMIVGSAPMSLWVSGRCSIWQLRQIYWAGRAIAILL